MAKYLVINFNRYDTDRSKYDHVEASSHKDAYLKSKHIAEFEREDPDFQEFVDDVWIQKDEMFGCLPGEENDILVYIV